MRRDASQGMFEAARPCLIYPICSEYSPHTSFFSIFLILGLRLWSKQKPFSWTLVHYQGTSKNKKIFFGETEGI